MIVGTWSFKVVCSWNPSPRCDVVLKDVRQFEVESLPEKFAAAVEIPTDQISSDGNEIWFLALYHASNEV